MAKYYTKCGMEFIKSTKAETTGYPIMEDHPGHIYSERCRCCPFVVDIKEGYGVNEKHKRFECRAGSFPPNHENTYQGSAKDKATLHVHSLDHNFNEAVIEFARNHPELGAAYNQDNADCRRNVSISCSSNKKGMDAKQELIDRFFPKTDERKCRLCGCTQNNACEGGCYWVAEDLCSKCAGLHASLFESGGQIMKKPKCPYCDFGFADTAESIVDVIGKGGLYLQYDGNGKYLIRFTGEHDEVYARVYSCLMCGRKLKGGVENENS